MTEPTLRAKLEQLRAKWDNYRLRYPDSWSQERARIDEFVADLAALDAAEQRGAGEASEPAKALLEAATLVANSMGDVVTLQRFARSVDPVRLVSDWHTTLCYAIHQARAEQRGAARGTELKAIPSEWAHAANSAKGLCESEANKMENVSPKTAEHWRTVAMHLGALYLTQDHLGYASPPQAASSTEEEA